MRMHHARMHFSTSWRESRSDPVRLQPMGACLARICLRPPPCVCMRLRFAIKCAAEELEKNFSPASPPIAFLSGHLICHSFTVTADPCAACHHTTACRPPPAHLPVCTCLTLHARPLAAFPTISVLTLQPSPACMGTLHHHEDLWRFALPQPS
jgi:hypothetical protein